MPIIVVTAGDVADVPRYSAVKLIPSTLVVVPVVWEQLTIAWIAYSWPATAVSFPAVIRIPAAETTLCVFEM
jgi:hypothetical protein